MMKKTPDTKSNLELAAFFDAAIEAEALPNAAFLDAVAADAWDETQARAKDMRRTKPASAWLSNRFRNSGGWQGVTALTVCACFGMYAGYSSPDSLDYLGVTLAVAETDDDGSFSIASDIEALFLEV